VPKYTGNVGKPAQNNKSKKSHPGSFFRSIFFWLIIIFGALWLIGM